MLTKAESSEHRRIKLYLASVFKQKGWSVKKVDGEDGQTNVVENTDGIGDGENKRPDIDGKDDITKRIIRGEAKVDNGDFETDHSITQYKLFSNMSLNGVNSWLIIGVPESKKSKMEAILTRELGDKFHEKIAVWES